MKIDSQWEQQYLHSYHIKMGMDLHLLCIAVHLLHFFFSSLFNHFIVVIFILLTTAAFSTYTLSGTKAVTGMVPFQNIHFCTFYIRICTFLVLIYTFKVPIWTHKGIPFEKLPPQWQLLYLSFWVHHPTPHMDIVYCIMLVCISCKIM